MEQPDEPDHIRTPVESVPDQVGNLREQYLPERVVLVREELAAELGEFRQPPTDDLEVFSE